jgi:dolichol-phosphate mannosyltransferase
MDRNEPECQVIKMEHVLAENTDDLRLNARLADSLEPVVALLQPHLSIVIPVFNERTNLEQIYRRLRAVMDDVGDAFEIIFVDDGSFDGTLEALRQLHERDPRVRVVSLSRNFGHQCAVTSGLAYASGKGVIVMDGDLQDPPEVIPRLIAAWREGYQVVNAVRCNRREAALLRMAYAIFYRGLRRIADVNIPLDAGDFSLMDRCVVEILKDMPERNRFVRGLRAWVGFRQTCIEYDRDARNAGKSKYSLSKLVKLALDGVVSHSFIPLHLVSQIGIFISLCALIGMVYLVWARLAGHKIPVGWTSLIVLILFLGGVQLLALGILGEYFARMFEEVKQRPQFVVRELLGLREQDNASRKRR